jgi:NAD(P)-dependent dehydrogenase (short-subunit alcohol dehydrogenase family)
MSHSAVITGASSGLGLELCKQLKFKGHQVTGVCRRATPELKALDVKIIESVDLSDLDALPVLADSFADHSIDLLFNNAGVFENEELPDLDVKNIRKQWEINALSPLILSSLMIEKMKPNSTIAMMTSRMGSITDNTSGGYYGYRMSKAALNMAAVSLAKDLQPQKICVALFHPGYVKTKMTSFKGDLTPQESVTGILKKLDQLDHSQSGKFWHTNGQELPW